MTIVIFAALIFIIPLRAQKDLTDIVKNVSPSIVIIFAYDKNGEIISQASGFFINKKGSIVTNYHVIEGAYSAIIKTFKGATYTITDIEADDPEGDIICLSIDIPQKEVMPLSFSTVGPQPGEKIAVIGNPMGLELTVSDGIVSAVREIPEFGNIIQITAPISPGSSGSPVVNLKGEVIGIATFQLVEGQNLNFAVPSSRIKNLILSEGKSLEQWKTERKQVWIGSAEELISQGISHLLREDYENALDYFKSAMAKEPNNPRAHFLAAYCQEKLGRYQQAIDSYNSGLNIEPDDFNAVLNLGIIYVKIEETQTALMYLQKAENLKPNDALPHYHLGRTYIDLKKFEKAVKHLKKSIQINPNAKFSHYLLGDAYIRLKRYQEAIIAFERELELYPENKLAFQRMGIAYSGMGKANKELECYMRALQIDPYNFFIHFSLYMLYDEDGFSEYINSYMDEIRKNPNDPSPHICLGMSYWLLKKHDKAKDAFKNVIRIIPDDPEAHYCLGSTYDELKQYTKAIQCYEQAIQINPNVASYYSSLGSAYYYTGQYNKAVGAYKHALAILPGDPPTIYWLGLAYLHMGDRNSALEQYKILKIINKGLAEALFNFIYE